MNAESSADIEMVKKHAEALGEHFDSVQIFTTRHEPTTAGGTATVQYGVGNYYARYGQAREWVLKQDEWTRVEARKEDD